MEADGETKCGNLEKKKSKSRRREREIFCYLSWRHRGGSSQPTMGATMAREGSLIAWSSDDARLQMGSDLRETIKSEEVVAVTEKRKRRSGREKSEEILF